jgi:hypothetical protein
MNSYIGNINYIKSKNITHVGKIESPITFELQSSQPTIQEKQTNYIKFTYQLANICIIIVRTITGKRIEVDLNDFISHSIIKHAI